MHPFNPTFTPPYRLPGAYATTPGAAAPEFARGAALTGGAPPWSPDSPLFWFGLVIAAAFGLVGVATEFRAGPAKAGIKIGAT